MEVSLKEAASILEKADNVIVTGHIYPDGDSLGSILALSEFLLARHKNVQMYIDDDIPAVYHFLPGVENIKRPEGKVEADLLVVLDASDDERIGKVKSITDAPILNIDHHISNIKFADFWYLDTQAAATGEIIMELLTLMQAKITPEIAAALYTAIATDCGFFRYANTTANTMAQAARLIECGAKPNVIAEALETKPLNTILALKEVLDSLEFYADGQVATITLLPELLEATSTTEGFINYPRNIEGVEVAVMFKVVEEGSVRISMRSKEADVSKIALLFGGGGHKRAAGCTLTGDIDSAKEKLLAAICNQLNFNKNEAGAMTAGIVNVLKPPGMTSHDIVSFIRRTYGLKKVGHAGTLDPAAAGVLPVFLGRATRLIEYAMHEDKSYRVELTLGYETDTGDDTGRTLKSAPFVMPSSEQIENILSSFVGEIAQVPPMYSAIKIDGKKLYELARSGVNIEVKPRNITIYDIKLLKVTAAGFLFDVDCSKGTYIRSLCIDIGKKLDALAVMSFLVRTRAGQFSLADTHTLAEITAQKEGVLLPFDSAIMHMPSLTLNDEQSGRFCCGQNISCQAAEGRYRVYSTQQELIGIGGKDSSFTADAH